MKKTSTQGFTLVELSVVMALVAILLVMILSFTSLTSLHTQEADLRGDFMAACTDYRAAVTDGFSMIDKVMSDENNHAIPFGCSTDGGVLRIGPSSFPLPEHLDSVTIETNTSGTLLRVTMTSDELSLTESFVIASHCGATFEVTEEDGGV